jgi:threonine/homoserine/homoserine lactone efflux protein
LKLELWLAFVATYTVISIVPGPSVLMVTGQALSHGTKAAFLCILGELVGGVVLVGLSLFGVGAILAASSELFHVVKWAGVFYMAYLGYRQIVEARVDGVDLSPQAKRGDGISSARAGFFTAILNPLTVS